MASCGKYRCLCPRQKQKKNRIQPCVFAVCQLVPLFVFFWFICSQISFPRPLCCAEILTSCNMWTHGACSKHPDLCLSTCGNFFPLLLRGPSCLHTCVQQFLFCDWAFFQNETKIAPFDVKCWCGWVFSDFSVEEIFKGFSEKSVAYISGERGKLQFPVGHHTDLCEFSFLALISPFSADSMFTCEPGSFHWSACIAYLCAPVGCDKQRSTEYVPCCFSFTWSDQTEYDSLFTPEEPIVYELDLHTWKEEGVRVFCGVSQGGSGAFPWTKEYFLLSLLDFCRCECHKCGLDKSWREHPWFRVCPASLCTPHCGLISLMQQTQQKSAEMKFHGGEETLCLLCPVRPEQCCSQHVHALFLVIMHSMQKTGTQTFQKANRKQRS